jgi:hypothetical protein
MNRHRLARAAETLITLSWRLVLALMPRPADRIRVGAVITLMQPGISSCPPQVDSWSDFETRFTRGNLDADNQVVLLRNFRALDMRFPIRTGWKLRAVVRHNEEIASIQRTVVSLDRLPVLRSGR